jgi:outer membrane protein TolC
MNCRTFAGKSKLAFFFVILLCPLAVFAQVPASLAEPLTLEAALQFADKSDQYQIQSAEEDLQQALSEVDSTHSVNDVHINLSGRLRKVGVNELGDQSEDNDSVVSLFVRKPLYDFGKTESFSTLAQLNVDLQRLQKAYLIEQRQISISQRYFDVLNADNEYLRNNEELAIGFIRFDRARENEQRGLGSDLRVKELQAAYEVIRQNRYRSENLQRLTRVLLADELGFPGQPPSEVAVPELLARTEISDDVEALVAQAFRNSLNIRIQQKKLDIAQQAIRAARFTSAPQLDAELEVSEYERAGSTRDDDWRATLYFDFPLYAGSKEKSAIDIATAKYRQALADMQRVRSQIRIDVLTLWQAIRQNSLRLGGELIDQEFRDMVLDRSRTEYQLEFKADLGDAMVDYSDSRMKIYQARFALEMAWIKLEKLLGRVYLDTLQKTENNNG